jgi:hypothetical protein
MRWFWFWLIGFGGLFVVAETIAIVNDDPGDTLTESLQWLVNNSDLGVILFVLFFVWFIPHILIKRFQKDEPKPSQTPGQDPSQASDSDGEEDGAEG